MNLNAIFIDVKFIITRPLSMHLLPYFTACPTTQQQQLQIYQQIIYEVFTKCGVAGYCILATG